jgi:two-component system chemotaxis response regulator CheB
MQQCPTPIVLISNDDDSARRSIDALAAGALAVVRKPGGYSGAAAEQERTAFLTTMRLMASVHVVTRHPARAPAVDRPVAISMQLAALKADSPKVLAIAASTGGPAALRTVLSGLGAGFPLPILIVQHISRGFVPALVSWLNTILPLPVRIARQNERLLPGHIYLAPDDHHLTVRAPGTIGLRPPAAGDRFCPSADPLFDSVARIYGRSAIGLVLTGMGDDGASGLLALRAAGAPTLAQDAASCVVYGMPRAAIEAGAVARSEPLATIAEAVLGLVAGVERTEIT